MTHKKIGTKQVKEGVVVVNKMSGCSLLKPVDSSK